MNTFRRLDGARLAINAMIVLVGTILATTMALGYNPSAIVHKKTVAPTWSFGRGWDRFVAILGGGKSAFVVALIAAAFVVMAYVVHKMDDSPDMPSWATGAFAAAAAFIAALVGLRWVRIEGPAVWLVVALVALVVVVTFLVTPLRPGGSARPRSRTGTP